jgi:hypothetical protein
VNNVNGSIPRDAVSCRKEHREAPEGIFTQGFDDKGKLVKRTGYMVSAAAPAWPGPRDSLCVRATGAVRVQLRLSPALSAGAPAARPALLVPEALPPVRLL